MKKKIIVIVMLSFVAVLSACGKISDIAENLTRSKETTAVDTTKTEKNETKEIATTAETTTEAEITTEVITSVTEGEGSKDSRQLESIRPEVKEMMDSYEAFIDEYCKFIQTYDASNTALLMEYLQLVQKMEEWSVKWSALGESELTEAESLYMTEVELRCSQKMLELSGNTP